MRSLRQWSELVGVHYRRAWRQFRAGQLRYPRGHAHAGELVPAYRDPDTGRIWVHEDAAAPERAATREEVEELVRARVDEELRRRGVTPHDDDYDV